MNAANEIIHQTMRLKIMSALNALRAGTKLEFQELKALLEATDGNLGTHLATLEGAGYIAIEKDFVGKKPRTRVAITRAGRRAFEQHVEYLREVIAGAGGASGASTAS
ncbi:MAG: transcriptional regulator [Proteobacteria bacterium]|nr:transcriptional regulator [Pseudomonadota bacterium]